MTLNVTLPPGARLRARVTVEPAARLGWSRRGDRLVVGGANSTVVVDGAGAEVERWPRSYTAFACGLDDACVAAATARGCVDLWRFGAARPGEPGERHGARVHAVVFSDDGARIYTAGEDGRVGCWRAATLDVAFWPVGAHALDVALDDASGALAVAIGRGGVVLLDGKSGARRGTLRPPDRATSVAFCGGLLAVGTRDGQLAVYDAARLEPVRPAVALAAGTVARLQPLDDALVAEVADTVVIVDAKTGTERMRWRHGVARDGGTLAVHAAQRALAVAVPAGVGIVDVAPWPPLRDVVALYHDEDAALCAPVLAALTAAGAQLVGPGRDGRGLVEAVRRGAACALLYGPHGPWPRHDWHVDVLQARRAHAVPVLLPGSLVPEAQRRFHPAAYVCFHSRVDDRDALDRVARAVLGR